MTKTLAYKHRPSVADEASVLAILRSLANKTKTVQVMRACMALKPKWVDLLNEVRRTVMWGRQRQKGDKSPESHHSFADHDLIIRHLSPQTHQGAQQHAASLKKVEDRLVARIRSALGRSRAKKTHVLRDFRCLVNRSVGSQGLWFGGEGVCHCNVSSCINQC